MLKGFRDFIMQGNVVELAVAVIMGAAFGAVVSAFADDFIGSIIGAIFGSPDFGRAGFMVGDTKIIIGTTITAAINFIIVAAAIYFIIVVPMNKLAAMRRRGETEVAPVTEEVQLLTEIRDALRAGGSSSRD